jgi:hypothetical protein
VGLATFSSLFSSDISRKRRKREKREKGEEEEKVPEKVCDLSEAKRNWFSVPEVPGDEEDAAPGCGRMLPKRNGLFELEVLEKSILVWLRKVPGKSEANPKRMGKVERSGRTGEKLIFCQIWAGKQVNFY